MPILFLDAGSQPAGATGPDLTRYFLVCAGLLGLVGALAFLARRYLSRHLRRRATKRSLSVVDVLPLGGKQKVCVVRCYDRTFLLGVGDREVHSIAELDCDEPVPDEAASRIDQEIQPTASFEQRLEVELEGLPQGGSARKNARWNDGAGVLG